MILSMVRKIMAGSGAEGNATYQSFLVNSSWSIRRYSPAPAAFNVCACSIALDCPEPRGYFLCVNGNNCTAGTVVWVIPGIIQSCVHFESLFNCDLSCFFNQTCLNTILSMYNVDLPTRLPLPAATVAISVLNSSASSRFLPNDTLGTIFDHLLIETWEIQSNFEGYFNICAPAMCTYTITQQLDVFYTIATIVGLLGGLLVTFRLLVLVFARLIQWSILLWRNRYAGKSHDVLMRNAAKSIYSIVRR